MSEIIFNAVFQYETSLKDICVNINAGFHCVCWMSVGWQADDSKTPENDMWAMNVFHLLALTDAVRYATDALLSVILFGHD